MRILTPQFKTRQANDFIEFLTTQNIFFFTGQTLPYPDDSPMQIQNNEQSLFYTPMDEMIFGKNVESEDASVMIPRIDWVSGNVYDRYDHEQQLIDKQFYVMTREGATYSVFKCLDNNKNSPSTHRPKLSETQPDDEFYQTSDGYIWKLMYTFTDVDYARFSTPNFIPFVANNQVSDSSINGAIDVIDVIDGGFGYVNYARGYVSRINVGGNLKKLYIQSNETSLSPLNNYYVDSAFYIKTGSAAGQLRKIVEYGLEGNNTYVILDQEFSPLVDISDQFEISPNITLNGNGSGFSGRAIINESDFSIDRVEIINKGVNYTYADVVISSNNLIFDTSHREANLRAIIPPHRGHGSNQQDELFGYYVCISENFATTEAPTANNDYRTFGIVESPIFNESILILDNSLGLSVGDTVEQESTLSSGTVKSIDSETNTVVLENVTGIFDITDVKSNSTLYSVFSVEKDNFVFDQRKRLDITFTVGNSFIKDEKIVQEQTNANGYLHEQSNNSVYLVQSNGSFEISDTNEIVGQTSGTKAIINNIKQEDAKKYTGNVYYVENIEPIIRSEDQSEIIKLIIGF